MELDPKLVEDLNQLESILKLVNNGFASVSKSATRREIEEKIYVKKLQELTGKTGEQAKSIAKQIEAEEAAGRKSEERNKAYVDGINKALGGLKEFTTGAVSSAASAYNATEVFSGVTGTIDVFSGAIKSVTGAFASLADGIPIVEGLAHMGEKLVAATTDLASQSLKIQLENAQKLIGTYQQLSKVGVAYGGDIAKIQRDAASVGLGMTTYSKFIKDSLDNFTVLGGGTQQAALRIAQLGKDIAKTDGRLLTMYGTFEELMSATADYQATMMRFGVDVTKNQKDLKESTIDYLRTQKELTSLTGISAEQYKKEAAERQTHLAYQMAIQRIGERDPKAAAMVERSVTMAGKFLGGDMQKLLEESIANESFDVGQAIDPVNAAFASQLSDTVRDNLNQYLQGARQNNMTVMTDALSKLPENMKEMAGGNEFLRQISSMPSVMKDMPEMIQALARTQSTIISQAGMMKDLPKALKDIDDMSKRPQTQESKEYNALLEKQQGILRAWDEKTVSSFTHVAELAQSLYDFQMKIVDNFPDFAGAVEDFGDYVANLLGKTKERDQAKQRKARNKSVNELNRVAPEIISKAVDQLMSEGKLKGLNAASSEYDKLVTDRALELFNKQISKGGISENLQKLLNSPLFAGKRVTATNDQEGPHKVGAHSQGKAADISIKDMKPAEAAAYLKQVLADPNVKFAQIEDKAESDTLKQIRDAIGPELAKRVVANANASGLHMHVEALAKGGITNGVSIAGEAGPEAVVPLPDGRTIPVKMDTGELVEKLEELINVMKENRDISEKTLWAQS